MHVEISVALNFVISYLYNRLPRRRVDLLAAELEKGLVKKFEGHWYPDKPFKGSAYRSVKVSGDKVDPVILQSAQQVGLILDEVKEFLPSDLTLWIDPNEVSYRIGEKGQVKILYSDKSSEEVLEPETDADEEVQATNNGFNPEAQCFNPEAQSFKPIDALSVSLGSLNLSPVPGGLSPSSPISSASWGGSQSTSPSGGALFPTGGYAAPTVGPKPQARPPMFTTATFAQTKFGSTKLKTNAKRPTRLSPTEFNNFFQQTTLPSHIQHPSLASPTRARSLSPRDPRVEFIVDQQQRMYHTQQQHLQQQFHQQQLLQQQHQQQQLNFQLYHHQQQQQQQKQQQQQQFQHNRLSIPSEFCQSVSSKQIGVGSLHEMFSGPSPLQSPGSGQQGRLANSPSQLRPSFGPHSQNVHSSPLGSPDQSPASSLQLTPDGHSGLLDSLGLNNVPYSTANHQLLLAS